MKKIFIDMDGVLAEYRKNCTENDMKEKGYFLTLRPEWNMIMALNMLVEKASELGIYVCVLTKVYPSLFTHSVNEKLQWRDKFLPILNDSQFVMVNGEVEEKSQAIKEELGFDIDDSCILIDDYNYNLDEWQSKGGCAIKYVNKINDRTKSFVGSRINHSMNSNEIFEALLSMISQPVSSSCAAQGIL